MKILTFDYETVSNDPMTAPVVSFGAIICDLEEATVENIPELRKKGFYQVFDVQEQVSDFGLVPMKETLEWWKKQSPEARAVFKDPNKISIKEHIPGFTKYCIEMGLDQKTMTYIRAPHFDFTIISNLAKRTGYPLPFNHWKVRDTRTACDIAFGVDNGYIPGFKEMIAKVGLNEHDAIDDCIKDLIALKFCIIGE